jgi:uncharacterized protein
MQYRKFGKLDWKVSALGFGAMRLPQFGSEMSSPVNESEAIKMIRYAIDNGVNYVDTAYPYHMGNSERVVGKALKDGYRQKIRLATKLTPHLVKSADSLDRYLDGQLERLQTNRIDYYLMHGLNTQGWQTIQDLGALKWAESRRAKGHLGYIGFSFHDKLDVFKKIVDAYDWTFCQIQYNYLDENYQAGRRGVEYAASKGLAIVVMEPLRGGALAKEPPPVVAKVWDSAKQRSRVEWALQWVWNQPEISVVLSGMSAMQQVIDNVAYAGHSGPNKLTAEELKIFGKVQDTYQTMAPVPCTACRYCQPCPNGVDIPTIFELYNNFTIYNDRRMGPFAYSGLGPSALKPEQRADKCKECGECEKVCPQQIKIPEELKKAHKVLTEAGGGPGGRPPGPGGGLEPV